MKKPKYSDPLTSAADLARLAKRDPRALSNPNMPAETLLTSAEWYPVEVERNPALGIISLDDPVLYDELQHTIVKGWRDRMVTRLSEKHKRFLAIDCAGHVLPPVTRNPSVAHHAVEAAKQFMQGKISDEVLKVAGLAARAEADALVQAADDVLQREGKGLIERWKQYPVGRIELAAYDAAYTVGCDPRYVVITMEHAAYLPTPEARWQEAVWQANRVRHYYAIDHLEYQIPASIGQKLSAVGSKPRWSDPATPPEELIEEAKREPRTYLNPNLPFEELLKGAGQYPWYVAANPVTPLLQLEDPEAFKRLHETLRHGWLERAGLPLLSETSMRLYLVDCAEHALPMYKREYPDDPRLHDALQVARQFALHPTSAGKLQSAHALALKIASVLIPPFRAKYNPSPAYYAVSAVAQATAPKMTTRNVINGATTASWATQNAYGFEQTLDWQLGRILHYIFLEHPEYQTPETVGARKVADKNDPMATPAQLEALAKSKPQEALANPNCPVALWWELAAKYPMEAQASLLFEMLTLEEPGRWDALEKHWASAWIHFFTKKLSPKDDLLFAADCAERVLPIFESKRKGDFRMRQAIESARSWVEGRVPKSDLHKAWKNALLAAKEDSTWGASHAARAAAYPSGKGRDAASHAGSAVYNSVLEATYNSYAEAAKALAEEQLWQWHHLQAQLRRGPP